MQEAYSTPSAVLAFLAKRSETDALLSFSDFTYAPPEFSRGCESDIILIVVSVVITRIGTGEAGSAQMC